MKFWLLKSLSGVAVLIFATMCLPLRAFAACNEPASGTLVICQPSANSTVFQIPHIEAKANPAAGSIAAMKVYIDGKLVFENGGPTIDLFEGGVTNGTHRLNVNAWDGSGRLYQAQQTFGVTGNLPFSCPVSGVGVRICGPTQGQTVSQNLGFSAGFKGDTPITRLRAYVDGILVFDYVPTAGQSQIVAGGIRTTPGTHTLTVAATNANHMTYTSSVGIRTYYQGDCPPKGGTCSPGIYPNTPNDGDDVQSPFRLAASVQFNTATITAMKVYVDGALAGTSSGPTFDQPITAARGTHIVVVQAWDTAGKLYRLTENVNVL
jgi:hypothetical protein